MRQARYFGHSIDDGKERVKPVVGQDNGREAGRCRSRLLKKKGAPKVWKDVPVEIVFSVVRKYSVVQDVEGRRRDRAKG